MRSTTKGPINFLSNPALGLIRIVFSKLIIAMFFVKLNYSGSGYLYQINGNVNDLMGRHSIGRALQTKFQENCELKRKTILFTINILGIVTFY